ncbi:DUF3718 domain-containing protein [Thalassotalea sp. M1531]|uniref:DUF3718 domain-containing protein n=1 Tax=Thalassotalea algicola TaxID=2716224 RepID=A0A7Y0LAA0_9GAMM|nr:DUF3718 domain-containing protein [Thalassotalea algicola]NMP30402.1 DUF3718 domain-containing protein [Thalassotalea algicola]
MNLIKLVSFSAGLIFASTSMAQQYQFVAMDNSLETKLCVKAGNDDAKGVKRVIRQLGVKERRQHINNIACNDMSAAKFAFKYQATNTFEYLNRLSYGVNKVNPSVTIKDVANKTAKPKVIYVSTAN